MLIINIDVLNSLIILIIYCLSNFKLRLSIYFNCNYNIVQYSLGGDLDSTWIAKPQVHVEYIAILVKNAINLQLQTKTTTHQQLNPAGHHSETCLCISVWCRLTQDSLYSRHQNNCETQLDSVIKCLLVNIYCMKFDNEAKHVVPKVEDLRTRVQSPPPPPYTLLSY